MNIKRFFKAGYIYSVLFGIFIILSISHSQTVLKGALNVILLWAQNVLPALLPFFIASQALLLLGCAPSIGRFLSPIMKLLGLPAIGGYPLAMSLLCGYPTGARMCGELYRKNYISLINLKPLCVLCHSSGPVFITGSVASAILDKPELGIPLLVIHYASCLLTGQIYSLPSTQSQTYIYTCENREYPIGEILQQSILSSIKAILAVCGYMLLFGVIISLAEDFNLLNGLTGGLIASLLEMTNGISRLNSLSLPIESLLPLCSMLLSFSGLSICLQALAFLPKEINPVFFIGGRLFSACISYGLCKIYTLTQSLIPPILTALLVFALLLTVKKLIILKTGRGIYAPDRRA